MKKLINHPNRLVEDMLEGYVAAYSDYIRYEPGSRVVLRCLPKKQGVGLVIGNGSGHEPIAMGWVGQGMLDANAVGDIFTAPPPELILEALRKANLGQGCLLLISNHAGDVLNGELAVEMAREEGLRVEPLLMYDDIASAPKGRESERRGAPGTTFIYKLVGARAEEGASLRELLELGSLVRDSTRSLSVAIRPGISPLTGEAMFTLAEDEIFIGMGVHGEAGFKRQKLAPAAEVVRTVTEAILDDLPFRFGDEVLVLVNGAGATTLGELLVVYRELDAVLKGRGVHPYKPLVGTYITTQEMAGVSVALCRTTPELNRLWDSPCRVPFFGR
ncbi:MAG: dihydroxyacetone kinase subunit DhaK [Thermaceae bacterium]|nr:dihydroxyacetone kinase subunit DhaK [Thermaceae bacterium]